MTIDSVQKSDTEKEYILEAHNDEGAYEYLISLSTSSEPAGELFKKVQFMRVSFNLENVTSLALKVTYRTYSCTYRKYQNISFL